MGWHFKIKFMFKWLLLMLFSKGTQELLSVGGGEYYFFLVKWGCKSFWNISWGPLMMKQRPISVCIHKVWTNQKLENLALSLAKSDHLASFSKIAKIKQASSSSTSRLSYSQFHLIQTTNKPTITHSHRRKFIS